MSNDRLIVCMIRPFDHKQSIYIYDGSELLEHHYVPMEMLPFKLIEVSRVYHIHNVHMHGHFQFSQKIVEKVQMEEFLKYRQNTLEFHIF